MKIAVKTQSGSTYVLNQKNMTWERARDKPYEGLYDGFQDHVRTQGGSLISWPTIVVGKPMDILGPPLTLDTTVRLISTTPVTEITHIHD